MYKINDIVLYKYNSIKKIGIITELPSRYFDFILIGISDLGRNYSYPTNYMDIIKKLTELEILFYV